eukprot:Opistho-1_new@42143
MTSSTSSSASGTRCRAGPTARAAIRRSSSSDSSSYFAPGAYLTSCTTNDSSSGAPASLCGDSCGLRTLFAEDARLMSDSTARPVGLAPAPAKLGCEPVRSLSVPHAMSALGRREDCCGMTAADIAVPSVLVAVLPPRMGGRNGPFRSFVAVVSGRSGRLRVSRFGMATSRPLVTFAATSDSTLPLFDAPSRSLVRRRDDDPMLSPAVTDPRADADDIVDDSDPGPSAFRCDIPSDADAALPMLAVLELRAMVSLLCCRARALPLVFVGLASSDCDADGVTGDSAAFDDDKAFESCSDDGCCEGVRDACRLLSTSG